MDKNDAQQATQDIAQTGSYIRTYAKDMAAARARGQVSKGEEKPTPPPLPPPPKPEPVIEAPKVPEPSIEDARQAVLARLRSNKEPQPKPEPIAPVVPPPAVPAPSQPEPIVPRMPEMPKPIPSPLPPQPQVQAPQPPAPPKPEPVAESPSPLHTYSTDFSDKMEREGASTLSVLAAQGNAAQTSAPQIVSTKKKSILSKVAVGLGVVLLAGAGIYGIYILVTGNEEAPLLVQAPSLVFADERRELAGPDYKAELAGLAAEPLVSGNVLVTYVTRIVETEEGSVTEPQPGGALIQALDLGAPDILLRNTEPVSTVGIIRAGSETRPFFVFRVTSFERTFAGMLTWEASIEEDLGLFYPPYPDAQVSLSTTTATTTTPAQTIQPMFRDEVVENHDVRVLRDTRGRSIMLYGYRNKTTLIIARDEASYIELANRLEAEQ